VPGVSNRGFLRLTTAYTFNPEELRQDWKNTVSLALQAYKPFNAGDSGYVYADLQVRHTLPLGWNEIRVGARIAGEVGNVWYVDELLLDDHLRIGFGLSKHTLRVSSLSAEFRYSLLRDKLKIGVFQDLGLWQHLRRDDPQQLADLAGSTGAGLFMFLWDTLQIDMFYGVGWSTDGYKSPGFALAIKEAF
jgi:hypothetical protein